MALLSAFQFLTKAEALNRHCKSVFTIEETNNLPDKGIFPYPAISNIEITEPGICFQIAILRHKSLGPENVHNYVLRETARHCFTTDSFISSIWQ